MGKIDVKSAYRIIPIHPRDRYLLGMKWPDHYFMDLALPFGLRSAPSIFNSFRSGQFVKLSFCFKMSGVYIYSWEIRPHYEWFQTRTLVTRIYRAGRQRDKLYASRPIWVAVKEQLLGTKLAALFGRLFHNRQSWVKQRHWFFARYKTSRDRHWHPSGPREVRGPCNLHEFLGNLGNRTWFGTDDGSLTTR